MGKSLPITGILISLWKILAVLMLRVAALLSWEDWPSPSFCSWQKPRPGLVGPALAFLPGLSSRFFLFLIHPPWEGEEQIKRGRGIQREKQNVKNPHDFLQRVRTIKFQHEQKGAIVLPGCYLTLEPKWVFSVKSGLWFRVETDLYTHPHGNA